MARNPRPASRLRVLVVDDEPNIRSLCREVLEDVGCTVFEAVDIAEARKHVDNVQLALLDVQLPDGSGLDLLHELRGSHPDLSLVIFTGYANVEDAVGAIKAGAIDYIPKPQKVVPRLREIAESLAGPVPAPRPPAGRSFEFHGIVAASERMRTICDLLERAARTPSTVLIQGESGTGKELAARAIHAAGPNPDEPFVPVDCSAIPAGLMESELFGHVRGAFTGAHTNTLGLFRSARCGTVFLDEIGELPPGLQAKLLRALQEREVRPVGTTRPEPFDARVVVATHRDLRAAMSDGEFRRDLFYRLHVVPILLPPLRERREDVGPLAQHFLKRLNATAGRRVRLSDEAVDALRRRAWAGNVRELHNAVERAFALARDDLIGADLVAEPEPEAEPARDGDRIADYEKQAIQAALRKTGGNREQAARVLEISSATLFRKLKKYELS
jgi:two-component system NtrC family response regulator